jgi:hypothetical protein
MNPVAVMAAVTATFGSTLAQPPTNFDPAATCDVQRPSEGSGQPENQGTDIGSCTRVAVDYAAGGAVAGRVTAPFTGTIRRLRLRAGGPGVVRVRLVRVRGLDRDGGVAQAAAEPRIVKLFPRGTSRVESFRVRLPVRKGDYLAFEGSSFTALHCAGTAVDDLIFQPLAPAPFQDAGDNDSCTLLVQATITRKRP